MAFAAFIWVGFVTMEASSFALGHGQEPQCSKEPPDPVLHESPTALMQLKTQVGRASSQRNQEPIEPSTLTPVGRTFLSMDPAASAQFLVEYYNARVVELPSCEATQRVAVQIPGIHASSSPSSVIAFIKDETLPAGDVDIEAIVGGMNSTLERALLGGTQAYWYPIDNHDGWLGGPCTSAIGHQMANGVPLGAYAHMHFGVVDSEVAVDVQIPHTFQTIQVDMEPLANMTQSIKDDCRTVDDPSSSSEWWKSTFVAANPAAAADFVVTILGARRINCPYDEDGPPNCTSAAWVELPGIGFQLHFARSSGDQRHHGEIDEFTRQVRSLRNITAGNFDLFMYNSLMLRVSSLDDWIGRFQALHVPFLVAQAAEAEYALFLDIPENNIIIQLRSDRMSASVPVLRDMCALHLKV